MAYNPPNHLLVEPRYYHGDGSKITLLQLLNEFGNSKLFELYLNFYCHRHGTTTAMEEV